jgi:outer membrane lipoprotein-sorting protein
MQEKLMPRIKWDLAVWLLASITVLGEMTVTGAAESTNADAIVNSLQKNYDTTTDFVADFRQETEVKTLNRSLKASGKLSFKRPGRMLWSYDEPK